MPSAVDVGLVTILDVIGAGRSGAVRATGVAIHTGVAGVDRAIARIWHVGHGIGNTSVDITPAIASVDSKVIRRIAGFDRPVGSYISARPHIAVDPAVARIGLPWPGTPAASGDRQANQHSLPEARAHARVLSAS
jgi:hypothetical protein